MAIIFNINSQTKFVYTGSIDRNELIVLIFIISQFQSQHIFVAPEVTIHLPSPN